MMRVLGSWYWCNSSSTSDIMHNKTWHWSWYAVTAAVCHRMSQESLCVDQLLSLPAVLSLLVVGTGGWHCSRASPPSLVADVLASPPRPVPHWSLSPVCDSAISLCRTSRIFNCRRFLLGNSVWWRAWKSVVAAAAAQHHSNPQFSAQVLHKSAVNYWVPYMRRTWCTALLIDSV